MFSWILLTKYLLNVKIYLFDTRNVNLIYNNLIYINNHFFLLNKYLLTVSKCLVSNIET